MDSPIDIVRRVRAEVVFQTTRAASRLAEAPTSDSAHRVRGHEEIEFLARLGHDLHRFEELVAGRTPPTT